MGVFFKDTATTEIYTLSLHDAFRSSLGVTEISDLKLATDLRLKLSYNCWEQMLERSRLWSLGPAASANRVEGGKTPCE